MAAMAELSSWGRDHVVLRAAKEECVNPWREIVSNRTNVNKGMNEPVEAWRRGRLGGKAVPYNAGVFLTR